MFELIRTIRIEGDRADGMAEVSADHPMLADHFPGRPLLPGTWLGAHLLTRFVVR